MRPAERGRGGRGRRHDLAAVGLAGALALGIAYLVMWLQVSPARMRGSDFSASYVAAEVWRSGGGAHLYDQTLEAARHASILLPGTRADLPFITPPLTAVLVAPLTVLDPETAFRVFSLLQAALVLGACAVAARAAPWPRGLPRRSRAAAAALGAAGAGTLILLLLGQWDGVGAAGLALAYASWRRDRRAAAGMWLALGAALAKPHLALGLAVWLLAQRERRSVGGAAMVLATVAALSVALVGPAGSAAWFGALGLALGHTPAASTLGAAGLVTSWIGPGTVASALSWLATAACLAGCAALGLRLRGRPERLEFSLAGAVSLSLLGAEHLLAHDLSMLAPVLVWCLARAATRDLTSSAVRDVPAVIALWLAVNVTVALDAGNGRHAPPGRLVPWALLAISAAAWVGLRSATAGGVGADGDEPATAAAQPALGPGSSGVVAYSGTGSGTGSGPL